MDPQCACEQVCGFPAAVFTNHHKLGGLKQQIYSLSVLEGTFKISVAGLKSGCGHGRAPCGSLGRMLASLPASPLRLVPGPSLRVRASSPATGLRGHVAFISSASQLSLCLPFRRTPGITILIYPDNPGDLLKSGSFI